MHAIELLEHAPCDSFFDEDQRPSSGEFRDPSNSGVHYVRGYHGGWDFPPRGMYRLLAPIQGTVRHVDFGPALGDHQFVVVAPDGSGWFFAHASYRVADGTRVKAGQLVGTMGNESCYDLAVHLHWECLRDWNNWYSCADVSARLSTFWEEERPLTEQQINGIYAKLAEIEERLKARVDLRAKTVCQTIVHALTTGSNNPDNDYLPDTSAEAERLKNNIAAVLQKLA